MTSDSPRARVGDLLRDWRHHRRLSQLDLALDAEISTRHLSFVETGRATPSRQLLLQLAAQLEVPLRERNTLLLAAGYAPEYTESSFDGPGMSEVRSALDRLLASHEPYPALAVDRLFNLVSANRGAMRLMTVGVAEELLAPPANVLRIALHPAGLAPRTLNFAEWGEHLLARLHRQAAATGDPELRRLEAELLPYAPSRFSAKGVEAEPRLYVPFIVQAPDGGELRFFSTISTFGTALDVTIAELAIEAFFPADEFTSRALSTAE